MTSQSDHYCPVLVVIVNYNAGELLLQCVRSALEQAHRVVIVDNASSDHSIQNIERSVLDGRLSIIRSAKNVGFAAACNLGASEAQEPYILFLNPDCVLGRHSLRVMVSSLEQSSDFGMAGGLLLNPDGTEQGGGRRAVPTPWRSFVRAFGLARLAHRWPKIFSDYNLHHQPLPDAPIEVEAISGALMLVKRKAFEEVGAWDEQYFLHCEDLDLCMQFRLKGWKIIFVPNAPVVHQQGTCSRSRPVFVEWHKHKGMMRFYRKFFQHQYPGLLMGLVAFGVWGRFFVLVLYYGGRNLTRRLRKARV